MTNPIIEINKIILEEQPEYGYRDIYDQDLFTWSDPYYRISFAHNSLHNLNILFRYPIKHEDYCPVRSQYILQLIHEAKETPYISNAHMPIFLKQTESLKKRDVINREICMRDRVKQDENGSYLSILDNMKANMEYIIQNWTDAKSTDSYDLNNLFD